MRLAKLMASGQGDEDFWSWLMMKKSTQLVLHREIFFREKVQMGKQPLELPGDQLKFPDLFRC
jgi:hypothetical protein